MFWFCSSGGGCSVPVVIEFNEVVNHFSLYFVFSIFPLALESQLQDCSCN